MKSYIGLYLFTFYAIVPSYPLPSQRPYRQTDRQTDRQRERERGEMAGCVTGCWHTGGWWVLKMFFEHYDTISGAVLRRTALHVAQHRHYVIAIYSSLCHVTAGARRVTWHQPPGDQTPYYNTSTRTSHTTVITMMMMMILIIIII